MSATNTASLRATGDEDGPIRWRPIPALLIVFAAYYLGAKLGFALTFSPNPISVLWPPNSILLGALLLAPRRMWPLLLLAAFPAHLLVQLQGSVPLGMVLCWFVSNATEALIGAAGVRLFIQRRLKLDNLYEVAVFVACAVLIGPFLSSFLDAAFVRLNQWGVKGYWELWTTRFFSNVLASVTLVPVILSAATAGLAALRSATPGRLLEAATLGMALFAAAVMVFDFDPTVSPSVPLYVPLPFLAWAALRFGVVGASASFALIALVTVWGAAHGRGPFTGSSPYESALIVQLFLIFVGITTLTLAALLQERRRAEQMRAHAQAELRESEAHFRSIADSAPVMIWTADMNQRSTFFNKRWLDFTGRSLEQELGMVAFADVSAEDVDRCRAAYREAFANRRAFELEFRHRRRDGSYRWILESGVPRVASDGSILGYIGSRTDITERHHLQRERQELAHISRISTMGELAASLAHELNQPLTAILANAHAALRLLSADSLEVKEIRAILQDIAEDDNRASEVIRRMRALASKGELELAPLDLEPLIKDVAVLVQSDAVIRGVSLSMKLDAPLPIRGDKVQLQQVVLNLVLNAFDAVKDRPTSDRLVTLRAERVEGSMVRVAVSDNGTGLSAENLDRIFTPFFTSKRDGLGLGLSISRSIIEAHGGRIQGANNPDRGASFEFLLPARDSADLG